ncbi:MAG: hypothetical protein PHF68_03540 [Candidatus ainarchaeum sp.]|jgi:uncharacterized protein (UPF0147 family)|nr:hypothetical protein [Candidatus ainarchaeum sp.]
MTSQIKMTKQEIKLLEELLKKCIDDEFCDRTTKQVALSILDKIKNEYERENN